MEEMDEFLLIASQQYEKSTSVQKTAELQQTPSENGVTEIVDVQKTVIDGRWGPLQTSDDVKMIFCFCPVFLCYFCSFHA